MKILKKLNKRLLLVLALLLLGALLCACGGDGEGDDAAGGDKSFIISCPTEMMAGERIEIKIEKSYDFTMYHKDYQWKIVGEDNVGGSFEFEKLDANAGYTNKFFRAKKPGTVKIQAVNSAYGGLTSNIVEITVKGNEISTAEELKAMSAGGAYVLTGDIDLGGAVWSPIAFDGFLDGRDHTVSNFVLNENADNLGFFSVLKGEVVDLSFENVTVSALSNKKNVGIIAGTNEGTVKGCTAAGTVNAKYATNVGGICGLNMGGTVAACKNFAALTAGSRAGGIVGSSSGTVSDCQNDGALSAEGYVGGIVGETTGKVNGCQNNAAVTASGDYVGGLIGKTSTEANNLKNFGDVASKGDYVGGIIGHSTGSGSTYSNAAGVTGRYYVGGFYGYTSGQLTGYKNASTVTGRAYVGGIVGKSDGKLIGCSNEGSVIATGTVTEESRPCSNLGGLAGYCCGIEDGKNVVDLTATGDRVGGLAGYCWGTVKNSQNDGAVSGALAVGGLAGRLVGSIVDSTNNGDVCGSDAQVGGFAGYMSGNKIELSTNNGTVSGADKTGGIVGYLDYSGVEMIAVSNFADVTGGVAVGGYIGYASGIITVTGMVNNNTVTGRAYVGGIVGQGSSAKLIDCSNYGSIVATGFVTESDTARTYVGGLAGVCNLIQNGKSVVDITGAGDFVGGLVGRITGNISASTYEGAVTGVNYVGGLAGQCTAHVLSCESNGTVTGDTYTGGLVGYFSGSKVEYSTNYADVSGTSSVGGLFGYASSALEVTEAKNAGNIKGSADVGSLIGKASGKATVRSSSNVGNKEGYYTFIGTYTTSPNVNPYIGNASTLSIKETDTVSLALLQITASDVITGGGLTVSVRIESGAQVAGRTLLVSATVSDALGNADVRYYEVKVYGTPTIEYHCNSISRAEYLAIGNRGVLVSFDLCGGTGAVATQSVTEENGLQYPAVPVREGYVFTGWYTSAACTGKPYDFSTDITTDFTLYAGWHKITTSGYGNYVLDILSGNNSADNAYVFSTKGSSLYDRYRYEYFTVLADGQHTIHYKNGSSTYSYGTHVAMWNVTTNKTILSKNIMDSTTYRSVSFTAQAGDVICIMTYRNSSNIAENYYTNFYFYVTAENTPVSGKTLLPDYVENGLLEVVATDSFGERIAVRTTVKSGEVSVGESVVYTMTATDAAGNVYTVDTAPIPITD